jgi:hypothetical protein
MKREQVRAILTDESLDESAKVSRLLALHHDELADIKATLKTDDEVKAITDQAVANALKDVPQLKKVEETDEYKALKGEYENYKYTTDIKAKLKAAKAKDKFTDDIIGKLKKEEDFETQLKTIKEQYGEYFDEDGGTPVPEPTPTNKPVFGTGNPHTGGQQTAEDIELAKARSQWK